MKLRIIINSLLIIFVLHLLLENIHVNYQIGDPNYESYQNKQFKSSDTLEFLTGSKSVEYNSDKTDMKKELFDYVKKVSVKPSNQNDSDYNIPNFDSNVKNVSKYYDSLETLPQAEYKSINKVTGRQKVSDESVSSVSWKYNNELPMNGGDMNGIFGYDSLNSNFAMIGSNDSNCVSNSCTVSADDLRMGLGNPNEPVRSST